METMLKAFGSSYAIDFSYDLRDVRDWNSAIIREIEFLSNVTAIAYEPVQGFLAVGTRDGKIAVFGSQAVGRITRLAKSSPIVSLHFASLVFKLLCVDQRGHLHVWDLGALSGPVLQATERFEESIQCIGVSPSHSHALIALKSGKVITYDLLCLCRSPYLIPPLWRLHEDKVESDMPVPPVPGSCQIMEVIPHPRDLNLVFLAHIGGVAIYNLSTQSVVRHYDLVIPPGAPGGVGYTDPNLLQHRRHPLTCMAIHPSGHIFAAGYADGCIAFWAVDDEDKPILVRTVDSLNVNIADAQRLSEVLEKRESDQSSHPVSDHTREPIFKLSWSGYGNPSEPYGYTTLSVLGGLMSDGGSGLSVLLLQPFNQVSPSTPTWQAVHPEVRREMLAFLESSDVYFYNTEGPTQDFLLIPRSSPHLGVAFDPTAVVLLSEPDGESRTVEAKEFPPPEFAARMSGKTEPIASPTTDTKPSVGDILASTLEELQITRESAEIALPTAVWTGVHAILDGDLIHMDDGAHDRLLQQGAALDYTGISRGGCAWVDYGSEGQSRDVRWTKYQARRVLVTHHDDLTVRFLDVSPQLLVGTSESPLRFAFPAPMNNITISLRTLLSTSCIISHARPIDPEEAAIQSVQLTSETLECAVTLRSGHVLIYAFEEDTRITAHQFKNKDEELVPLDHLAGESLQFQPRLLIDNKHGAVSVCKLSNIGFVAVAYSSGALLVIDLRFSRVVFRDVPDAKVNKRHSFPLHRAPDPREVSIQSMRWFVSGYDSDPTARVRLVASYRDGDVRVFTVARSNTGDFTLNEESKRPEGTERPLPHGMFLLDSKNGTSCCASGRLFANASLAAPPPASKGHSAKDEVHHYWISAGAKGAKCIANFTGAKISKVDWGKNRSAECVEVIARSGAQALVAIMSSREVLVYALPSLEPLHTFQLQETSDSAISVDDTGDYIDWTFDMRRGTVTKATMGTLFAIRRVFDEPVVDLSYGRKPVPAMPPSVPLGPTSLLGSWFRMNTATMSGDQVDALFAGPDRPIPEDTSIIVNNQWQRQIQTRAQALANQSSRMGADIYNNLTSAVSERGELLSGLEDSFRSLGEGGRKMMFEAKRLAAEQSAKRWLG